MSATSGRDLVLLLVGLGPEGLSKEGLGGITRMQKLLFLLEREEHIEPSPNSFGFIAYKAGPCSTTLYDHLELLENLGLLESEVAADATEPEAEELNQLDFDTLMASGDTSSDDSGRATEAYEERRFRITEKGRDKILGLLGRPEIAPIADGIRRVKSRFGRYSLSDLLYYVYTKYPEMAVESEIRDKIMKRRR